MSNATTNTSSKHFERILEITEIHFGTKEIDPALAYLLEAMISDQERFAKNQMGFPLGCC